MKNTSTNWPKISDEQIRQAYQAGRLVALPTETVYGLAAPIDRPDLIERIFELKQRPKNDPLIVHVSSIEMAKSVFHAWDDDLQKLAEAFWPGPLTIVAKKDASISNTITSGETNVAVRMPNHPLALQIIDAVQCPVVAPSANPFTKLSPTKAQHVCDYFSENDVLVVDGGECQRGIESTIVLVEPSQKTWKLLRSGPVKLEEIGKVLLSYTQDQNRAEIPLTPGSHHKHYRPAVPFYLVNEGESLDLPGVTKELILSSDFKQAESELYSQLHALALNADQIFFRMSEAFLNDPNWNAIRDRLKRASSKLN